MICGGVEVREFIVVFRGIRGISRVVSLISVVVEGIFWVGVLGVRLSVR